MRLVLLFVALLCTTASASAPKPRIIGGKEVDIARHPYLVSLRYRTNPIGPYLHMCAGAIYSKNVVLTAAQCIDTIEPNHRVLAVAAANTRNGVEGLVYVVKKWVRHADYSSWTIDYDVGIMIIDGEFDFAGWKVKPIALSSDRPLKGKSATTAGWGYREEWGPSSHRLEEVTVPIWSNEDCTTVYGKGEITERMICAGWTAGGKDACQGDSGGPLVIEGQLLGLVSWGRGCARPGYPGVYTYVPALKKWIDDIIEQNA